MHAISDLDLTEDRDGRPRVAWVCECGSRGSGATQAAAMSGFKRHVRAAARKSDW
ncbi:hypothetical protein [Microbacterium sp. cx-59]|uniref:hypothetical protein n=1 Tax=Microbacterium sp. cx-59 TaxID=2891207 RepID=UPI001E2DF8AF|nr:hypothetical protein [Microbacterium sp. cx-59]MCC4906993.1 hypothetical protein [Microbacterium sp. cx-59]